MAPKVAIIIYSLYGHTAILVEAEKRGVEAAGGIAHIYQVPETLSPSIIKAMGGAPKPSYPIATSNTLLQYDYFLFGIPTRFGNSPAQWKAFWDATGGLWAKGSLHGKVAGVFVSTGTGGGNEITIVNSLSVLAHHGIIYVPLGYANVFGYLSNLNEAHGGSPWGAGALAAADGSRKPSELELTIHETQGKTFVQTASKF
ncbi:probable Protoplast secreted protein 2 [Zygosaccharomyces bailii ISA1307]|nr:probable Protoplast secreted protein 2 [Zygosaccharomyces bailii ISA1307]